VYGLDWFSSKKLRVVGYCENGKGVSGFITDGKFRKIGDFQRLQKVVHDVCLFGL
jgi:hypothetical protein